jgi:hypothetical protein
MIVVMLPAFLTESFPAGDVLIGIYPGFKKKLNF